MPTNHRPGDCIDFTTYAKPSYFGSHFTIGWFTFTSTDRYMHPQVPYWGNVLTFGGSSVLTIDLEIPVNEMSIQGTTGASREIKIIAYNSAGDVADTAFLPGNVDLFTHPYPSVSVSGTDITRVTLEATEPLIESICVAPIDVEEIFKQYLEDEFSKSPKLKEIFSSPEMQQYIENLTRDITKLYESPTPLKLDEVERSSDDNSSGNHASSGFGFNVSWPPDWKCVALNLVNLALSYGLTLWLASELGILSVTESVKEMVITALTKDLGYSAPIATAMWYLLKGAGGTYKGLDGCW